MKKLAVILLTAMYTVLAAGIHLHLHYCCGKLTDISLNDDGKNCRGDEQGQNNACSIYALCCATDEVHYALEDEHCGSVFQLIAESGPSVQLSPISSFTAIENAAPVYAGNGSPPARGRLFVMHSSLMLYA
ncbi:MAG: HYC_CC_PP family protein [Flavobacteriales bacterium]